MYACSGTSLMSTDLECFRPVFGLCSSASSVAQRWLWSAGIPGFLQDRGVVIYCISSREASVFTMIPSVSGIPVSSQFSVFCSGAALPPMPVHFFCHKLRSYSLNFPFKYSAVTLNLYLYMRSLNYFSEKEKKS